MPATWLASASVLSVVAAAGAGPASIVNGSDDRDDAAVVGLVEPDGSVFCTGTLVSSIEVLTAAHCVIDREAPPGIRIDLPGSSLPVVVAAVEIELHAGFDPTTLDHDLALVRLERPAGIQPVVVRPERLRTSELGRLVRIVGYGTDAGETGPRKRTGFARLDALDRRLMRLVGAPALPCFGDSGAPVLATREGEVELVGVISRGDSACADHALATRADDEAAPLVHPARITGGCAAAGGPGPAALLLIAVLVMAAPRIKWRLAPSIRDLHHRRYHGRPAD